MACLGTGLRTCDDDAVVQIQAGNLRALLRSAWAVRVLDAWAGLRDGRQWRTEWRELTAELSQWECFVPGLAHGTGLTSDAARMAAALAVYPTLPEAVRAELGECP